MLQIFQNLSSPHRRGSIPTLASKPIPGWFPSCAGMTDLLNLMAAAPIGWGETDIIIF